MGNPIVEKSLTFAVEIISFTEELTKLKKYVISNQLLRSGTSIGANVKEAQGAESKVDFRHKMRIAYKEAQETEYWLSVCKLSPGYPTSDELINKVQEIIRILGSIIASCRQ